ncbi:hypothetical protein NKH09_23730, partial [Mesorhizobium sp. M1339]|uniref:hypothetical protein n=1 Tax=Mesorhizobium sp. M1339 TaxID=2957086 RepID=UPI00333A01CC
SRPLMNHAKPLLGILKTLPELKNCQSSAKLTNVDEHDMLGLAASFETFGRIGSATARYWVLVACVVSRAKAVVAATTRRQLLQACASTLQ